MEKELSNFMAEVLSKGGITIEMVNDRVTVLEQRYPGIPRGEAIVRAGAYYMALCLAKEIMAGKIMPMLEDYPFEDRMTMSLRGDTSYVFMQRCDKKEILDELAAAVDGVLAKHGAILTNEYGTVERMPDGEIKLNLQPMGSVQ